MAIDTRSATMRLWAREEPTDPKFTKSFTRGGGFRGTAINPTYVRKRLTHAFGPVGLGWGVEVLADDVVTGAPVLDADGKLLGHESVQRTRVRFWYFPGGCAEADGEAGPLAPVGPRAETEQVGQTHYVTWRRGKNGEPGRFETDEEAWKKSLTDALTKAASEVGIGADVHLGLFDDSKYANDRARQAEADQGAADAAARREDVGRARQDADRLQARLEAAGDAADLDAYEAAVRTGIGLTPALARLGLHNELAAVRAATARAQRRIREAAEQGAASAQPRPPAGAPFGGPGDPLETHAVRSQAARLLETFAAVADAEAYSAAVAAALQLRPALVRLGLSEDLDALRRATEAAKARAREAAGAARAAVVDAAMADAGRPGGGRGAAGGRLHAAAGAAGPSAPTAD